MPDSLGSFDIGVLGCVLLHCSCPVRIVEQVARRVQTIIIAEPFIDTLTKEPACWLIPSSQNQIVEAWWRFSPMFFTNYLEVLGFKKTTVIRHRQFSRTEGKQIEMFTVVGQKP